MRSCLASPKPSRNTKPSIATKPLFWDSAQAFLEEAQRLRPSLSFVDGKVYAYWKPLIDSLVGPAPLLTIQGGESVKTLPTARRLWKKLWQYRLDRGQVLFLIGGGSLLDVGAFCASTWKRGIPFVHIPTTFVAQIDAALGGKSGINFRGGKNLIGTFAQPAAIWGFTGFLETLPERELHSGWVEALKHALLAGGALWEELLATPFSTLPKAPLLERLAAVKLEIVTSDPIEQDQRRLLNLGHTLGHVWEALSLGTEKPLTHGEAVALGLLQEAWLSHRRGLLPEPFFQQLYQKLQREELVLPLPPFTWQRWEGVLLQDKKIRAQQLYLPLWEAPGRAQVYPVEVEELRAAVRWYRAQLT